MGLFIQATDKRFYLNPVVYLRNTLLPGGEKYTGDLIGFIMVDDADEVIALINSTVLGNFGVARRTLNRLLLRRGIDAKVTGLGARIDGAMPPDYKKMESLKQFILTLRQPIPVPEESKLVRENVLGHDEPYLAWEMQFTLAQVKHFLDNPKKVCALATFLSGLTVGWNPRSIRGMIFNQHIDMNALITAAEMAGGLNKHTVTFARKGVRHVRKKRPGSGEDQTPDVVPLQGNSDCGTVS